MVRRRARGGGADARGRRAPRTYVLAHKALDVLHERGARVHGAHGQVREPQQHILGPALARARRRWRGIRGAHAAKIPRRARPEQARSGNGRRGSGGGRRRGGPPRRRRLQWASELDPRARPPCVQGARSREIFVRGPSWSCAGGLLLQNVTRVCFLRHRVRVCAPYGLLDILFGQWPA